MKNSRRRRSIPLRDASILATLAQVRSGLADVNPMPAADRELVDGMLAGIEEKSSQAVARILIEGFKNGRSAKVKRKPAAESDAPQELAREFVRWARRGVERAAPASLPDDKTPARKR